MNSSLISKIEKGLRYAEEKDRAQFKSFSIEFRGGHDTHLVSYESRRLSCDCHFFSQWNTCSHTMAMERILSGMLEESAPIVS